MPFLCLQVFLKVLGQEQRSLLPSTILASVTASQDTGEQRAPLQKVPSTLLSQFLAVSKVLMFSVFCSALDRHATANFQLSSNSLELSRNWAF